jgi:DNA-binding IclR family transcriptional regulator
MDQKLKRVPAIDKCFAILGLLAQSKEPLGISEISQKLGLNKSTVFSISHTLKDLDVLQNQSDGKFVFGTRFYVLSNMAGKRSALIQTAHPYLEKLSKATGLSVFLGLRSDRRVILVDKVDSASGIKVSSEIGLRMPTLAGAVIKAMLAELADEQVVEILERSELRQFTPNSITNKTRYLEEIRQARIDGVAFDREEYIEGMTAIATPVKSSGGDAHAAIWMVGMTRQMPEESFPQFTGLIRSTAEEINHRLQ